MTESARRGAVTKHADVPFVVVALASGVVLLYLGRSLTFWHDEWRSITFDGGFVDFLRPVNQHWSTFPLLLYRGTFAVIGLRSYVPYLAEVIVLHLLAVAGAYALMRNRVGPLVATLVAIPLLFLGTGAENLFWAFQTGFVGSVMFGAWALFFLERPWRHGGSIASVLLLASLMSSGMGLFFLAVAAGRTILDPPLRSRALAVVPPFALYVLWFGLVGRDQVSDDRIFFELSTVRFVVRGVVYATERVSGLGHLPDGHLFGALLFIALTALVAHRIIRGRTPALAVACLVGVVTTYTVVAAGRAGADPGYDHATASRFVYVAAFFLVLAIVDLLPERGSWSGRGRRARVVVPAALLLALGLATVANLDALRDKREEFQRTANVTRALVGLALERGDEPWVDRHAPRGWMPSIAELERVVARHGSPVEDELFPGVVEAPDATAEERALLALIGDGFRVEEVRGGGRFAQIDVGSGASRVGPCARVRLSPETAVWVRRLQAPARVRVSTSTRLEGRVFLAHDGGPARPLYPQFEPGVPRDIVVPDVGDARAWNVAVDSPLSPGVLRVCVLLADGHSTRQRPGLSVRQWE